MLQFTNKLGLGKIQKSVRLAVVWEKLGVMFFSPRELARELPRWVRSATVDPNNSDSRTSASELSTSSIASLWLIVFFSI